MSWIGCRPATATLSAREKHLLLCGSLRVSHHVPRNRTFAYVPSEIQLIFFSGLYARRKCGKLARILLEDRLSFR